MKKLRKTYGLLPGHLGRYFTLMRTLLLFVLLVALVTVTAAQDPQPTAEPDTGAPPRQNVDREAPLREPVILSQHLQPDNTVNTLIAIPAAADTYIASGRPNQNFGSAALFLGYNQVGDAFGAQRLLIRFNVQDAVPEGAVINGATLRLRLNFSSPVNDAPMNTVLRRLASPWNEFTVTWNTEPAWTGVDTAASIGSVATWYDYNVTDLVAGWNAGTFPNHGVIIIGDETVQQRERAFYSRETTTAFFPHLVVDFTDLGDTEPPVVTVDPLPEFSPRSFTVSWTGEDQGASGIAHYDVQYREDGGDWINWLVGVTFTSAEFSEGRDGRLYEFRARGVDNVGNIEPFGPPEANTTVDTQPPLSTVEPLPPITQSNTFTVSWSGEDTASGIAYFDVQVRYNNGPWTLWLPQTTATSALFTAAADGVYNFEVRAVDNVGHVEPFANQAEATTVVDVEPPFVEPQLYFPILIND